MAKGARGNKNVSVVGGGGVSAPAKGITTSQVNNMIKDAEKGNRNVAYEDVIV